MKNILLAVLVLSSTQAFASKARYKALNSSFHLTDTQTEFASPYHTLSVKDFVSFETGLTAATSDSDGAEGMAKFSIDENSKLLVAVGHKDETVYTQRKFLNAAAGRTFAPQQNPVELIYGVKTDGVVWGGGFYYSNYKDKKADNNESSNGIRLGASHGDFKWKINLGLTNKVQDVTNGSFEGKAFTNVALRYNMGVNRFGLDYTSYEAARTDLTGTQTDNHAFQDIKFQYAQTFAKDGEDFFYGLAVDSLSMKNKLTDKKLTRLALPVYIGLENQAADWLTLRGSIKQVVWAQTKDENGYAAGSVDGAVGVADSDNDGDLNSTEVATGVGLKFNKVLIDGTLKAMTGKTQTAQINSANLLALVAVTYEY